MDKNKFIGDYKKIISDAIATFRLSDEELQEIRSKGIDFSVKIPISEIEEITIGEYFDEINKKIVEIFVVSDSFCNQINSVELISEEEGEKLLSEMRWLFTKEGISSSKERVEWVMNEIMENPSLAEQFKSMTESMLLDAIKDKSFNLTPMQCVIQVLHTDAMQKGMYIVQIQDSIDRFLGFMLELNARQ